MKKRFAFTLVEVLIAVVILVIVIGGFIAVETGNIKVGTSSKYNVQANGLGQEGINIVKSLSDKVKVGGTNGGDCKDPSNCDAGVYYIDDNNQLMRCKDINGADVVGTGQSAIDVCVGEKSTINGKEFTSKVVIP